MLLAWMPQGMLSRVQGTTDGFALELMVGTGSISWARQYGSAGTLESLFSVTHSANGVMYAAGFQAGEGKGPIALTDFTVTCVVTSGFCAVVRVAVPEMSPTHLKTASAASTGGAAGQLAA